MNLRQDVVLLHYPQYRLGILVDPLALQPQPHPPVAVGLPHMGLLLLEKLTQFRVWLWPSLAVNEVIVAASGNPEECAHD